MGIIGTDEKVEGRQHDLVGPIQEGLKFGFVEFLPRLGRDVSFDEPEDGSA